MKKGIAEAVDFVTACELPDRPRNHPTFSTGRETFAFQADKPQSSVVGGAVVAFDKGVTPQQRRDLSNAFLLAQLVAKKKVPNPESMDGVIDWYVAYFDVLERIGFVIEDRTLSNYEASSETFEAHQMILDVATALLGAAPGALALVAATLTALQKLSATSKWITLFDRESHSANTARFQMTLAGTDENGNLSTSILAFGIEAEAELTQVLFFTFHKNQVKLRQHSGRVIVNAAVMDAVRASIAQKVAAFATEFVEGLDL